MKHLNNNYDRLNVAAKTDLLVPSNRASTIEELEILEDYLQGEVELNNAALKSLKCGRPVCDGGDRL